MPNYVPLQPSLHRHAGFRRASDLHHAAQDRFAPILIDEIAQVLPYMPLCFIRRGDEGFQFVAMQGVGENQNLFVHPVNHKWLVGYTPACYRGYPFALGKDAQSGSHVLCFDMNSGLMCKSAEDPGAVAFFDSQGQPAQAIKDTLEFLKAVQQGQQRTQTAVDALTEQGLIETWPLAVQSGEGKVDLSGLYRINAKALQELSAEALEKLNAKSALQMAHAQIFSQSQLSHLAKLQSVHSQVAGQTASENLDELFDEMDDDLSFDFDS